jgi:hypothetical protein
MDLITRVDDAARDLLARVDAILLAAGVPAGHPVARLLPAARALPGEVFAGFADASPAALNDVARALRGLLDGYATEHLRLAVRPRWEGATAEAALARATGMAEHLYGHADDTLGGRLSATARYLIEVAAWLSASRDAVAATVARCLASAEAVTVRSAQLRAVSGRAIPEGSGMLAEPGGLLLAARGAASASSADAAAAALPPGCALAAATIAAEVLGTALRAHGEGCDLYGDWSARLTEVPYRPGPQPASPPAPGRLDLPL